MSDIYCPLTYQTNVKHVQDLNIQQTIANYQKEIGIDISRFFANIDRVSIYECQTSHLQFYYPFTLAGDGKFYADLSESYKNYYSPWKWEHQLVYSHLKEGMNVLEIGCGYGYFLQKARQAKCLVTGLELNEKAVAYGKEHSIPIIPQALSAHAMDNPETYDMVCSFQVFEHVIDIRTIIADSLKSLKKGGIFAMGVPNNDAIQFSHDLYHTLNLPPHHMLLWNRAAIAALASLFNLEVIAISEEPASKIHKSMAYKVLLQKKLGNTFLTQLLYVLTRPIIKRLPFIKIGATIVGVFRKK